MESEGGGVIEERAADVKWRSEFLVVSMSLVSDVFWDREIGRAHV